VAAPRMKITS